MILSLPAGNSNSGVVNTKTLGSDSDDGRPSAVAEEGLSPSRNQADRLCLNPMAREEDSMSQRSQSGGRLGSLKNGSRRRSETTAVGEQLGIYKGKKVS
jgi:hypothetical protein